MNVLTPVPPPATGSPVAFVRTSAEGVPSAGVTRVGEIERTTSPVPFHTKREDVAMFVGTADAPVMFAHSELALMAAKLMVEAVPPTCEPRVPEDVNPVLTARVEVATPYADPAPVAEYTNTLLPAIGVVVESPVPPPVDEIVIGEEPIAVNAVQEVLPPQVTDVVATEPRSDGNAAEVQ